MPIEILPEGEPDWSVFSATTGILFLGIDVFWQSKAEFAILYRGGAGFLDRSIDDGQNWSSILPSTDPPWFGGADFENFYYSEPPYGMPVGSAPLANQLTYGAYSSNHAHSGEHYVLASYTLTNGGGLPGSQYDVHITWVLYTTDDWATHKWSMMKPYVYRGTSAVSDGTPTTLTYSDADKPEVYGTRLSDTKVALWTTGTGVPEGVYILTESSGTLTEAGYTAGAVEKIMFNRNGDYLYFGAIYQDRSVGGIEYYRARVYEWDVTGVTPSLTTYESGDLPSLGTQTDTANVSLREAWHLTDSGRLCFRYRIADGFLSTDTRKHYLFYFDVVGQTWSTPFLYHDGLGNTVPYNLMLCGMTVDGSNKMVVVESEEWDWSGKSGNPDYELNEFMWVAGTWTKFDETNFYSYPAGTMEWRIYPSSVSELSGNRLAFWITRWFVSGASGIAEARIYTYNTTLNTISYQQNPAGAWPATVPMDGDNVQSLDERDSLHVIGYNKMDNPTPRDSIWIRHPLNRSGSAGDRMYWSDADATPLAWDEYFIYSSAVSYDVVCLLTGYNADGSAEMIRAPWVLNGSYTIDASVLTVDERDTDMVLSRLPSGGTGHQLACALDGARVFVAMSQWDLSDDDSYLLSYIEYLTRHPDGQTGVLDYPVARTGHLWWLFAESYTYAQHTSLAQYISLFPWAKETDGVLAYGLPYGGEFPTWPDQIYGVSPTAGDWYYWGSSTFTDPVRAVFLYNSKVYALLNTSTSLDLYVEKDTLSDGGDDMQLVSATTLDDASVGIIAAVDGRDGTFIVTGVTDTIIVIGAAPPWTSWGNLTLSHRIDLDVTGVVVL